MAANDEAGAVAGTRYFLELYTYTRTSGDTAPWSALTHDQCGFCGAVAEMAAEATTSGRTVVGAEVTVHDAFATEVTPGQTYGVTANVTEARSVESDASGTEVAANPASDNTLYVLMTWTDGWVVREVDVLPADS